MKIVLAGSPEIALDTFKEVIRNFNVVAIVTQPDKPKGRGMKLTETPVSKLGNEFGIKVFKPQKIINIYEELKNLEFDIFLTFAYGQWIPTKILNLAKIYSLNIHGSLLPKYRGAAPIHHAILNGDSKIGITLIEMVKKMDAGDMFYKSSEEVNEHISTGDGIKIISYLAKKNIVNWIKNIKKTNPTKQGEDFSLAPKIEKEFGFLSQDISIEQAKRKIMALTPFPSAFLFKDEKRIKILDYSENEIPFSIPMKFSNGTLYATKYKIEGKKLIIL